MTTTEKYEQDIQSLSSETENETKDEEEKYETLSQKQSDNNQYRLYSITNVLYNLLISFVNELIMDQQINGYKYLSLSKTEKISLFTIGECITENISNCIKHIVENIQQV